MKLFISCLSLRKCGENGKQWCFRNCFARVLKVKYCFVIRMLFCFKIQHRSNIKILILLITFFCYLLLFNKIYSDLKRTFSHCFCILQQTNAANLYNNLVIFVVLFNRGRLDDLLLCDQGL